MRTENAEGESEIETVEEGTMSFSSTSKKKANFWRSFLSGASVEARVGLAPIISAQKGVVFTCPAYSPLR